MTYAPARLLEVRHYVQPIVKLPNNSLGIAPDPEHDGGYHCGWDRRRIVDGALRDYAWQDSARDNSHRTDAASAFDLGWFEQILAGRRVTLLDFNAWLVGQCAAGAADTLDIREVIYTPDRRVVLRWDRLGRSTSGDPSHLNHTHISYFRDAEGRDKTGPYKRFFDPLIGRNTMLLIKTKTAPTVYVSDGLSYRPMGGDAAYPAFVAATGSGALKLVEVADLAQLEALAGKPATEGTPVHLSDGDRAAIAAMVAAELLSKLPQPLKPEDIRAVVRSEIDSVRYAPQRTGS